MGAKDPLQRGQRQAGSRARGRWPSWALALGSTLVALLAAEATLSALGFSYPLYPEKIEFGWPDPVWLESFYLPDDDLLWVRKDYAETLTRLAQERPQLVLLGDSCVELGDTDEYLAQRLREHGGGGVRVAKLGTAGWSSYQGLRQLERDVVGLRPAVVTVQFGWNDHWMGFGIEDAEVGRLRSPLVSLLERSRVFQLGMKAGILAARGGRAQPLRVPPTDFRENLRQIVATAEAHGITAVLLTAPTSHRKGREPPRLLLRQIEDLAQLVPLHQRYAEIVREVAEETGAPLCDLSRDFAALPEPELARYFENDGIHLTKGVGEGYDRLAGFLLDCFERERLLGRLAEAERAAEAP
jgi:lysophospholipase L1-like esterase